MTVRARTLQALAAALSAGAMLAAAQSAEAATLTKLPGTAGCVAGAGSTLPAGTCEVAKGIDDATDVAISPDGRFAYAASYSSNSVAIFARDGSSGELSQLPGTAGCIAWDATPIAGCASGNGLEGPTAIAISPDGDNVYVTGYQLDPGATPPQIAGTLTSFSRDPAGGTLSQIACAVGGAPPQFVPSPPSGCVPSVFPQAPTRGVPLGTASDVEVSPDGGSVVTSSFLPSAIVNWNRDEDTGALSPRECFGSARTLFPTNGGTIGTNSCAEELTLDTGGPADGLAYPLDVEFSPGGGELYAAALGLELDAGPPVGSTDEPGSVAIFDRAAGGGLTQPAAPDGCVADTRDPAVGCDNDRTGLLNPYRVAASPDGENVYVSSLNVFPPSGVSGPGPGELAQLDAGLQPLDPPCLQQLGLPVAGLEPTAGCSLSTLGLILPSDVAFSPDGASAYVSSLFHSVGSYVRDPATGQLVQDPPTTGCSIDPRDLPPGSELLASLCQNAVPLGAPTSIEVSPDGRNAYVTSGGFLTGNSDFGPALAAAGISGDDAITVFGPTPPAPPGDLPAPGPAADAASCRGVAATIVAESGAKRVRGTKGDDVIVGTSRGERIIAGGGEDRICAGDGGDVINAGGGADDVRGAGGADRVRGGGGSDVIRGGGGRDRLRGDAGGDRISGNGGADRLSGNGGRARLRGGPGRDRVKGGPGRDRCGGKGTRKDRLRGCER